jgi:hypothetical protein
MIGKEVRSLQGVGTLETCPRPLGLLNESLEKQNDGWTEPEGGSRGSLGLVFSAYHDEYCHNGGMAFAHHHGVGLHGSTMAIMVPSGGPLKTGGLQGNAVDGFRAFWGQRWTRLLVAL